MAGEYNGQQYSRDETGSFVELCHRAVTAHDQRARERVQYKVFGVMRDNLRHHPWYGRIRNTGNEEQYIAQAFERFWQSADAQMSEANKLNGHSEYGEPDGQQAWFDDQSAIFRRLQAALNSVVLDILRTETRPREAVASAASSAKAHAEAHSLWGLIQRLVPDRREQRVAYLLYHCGLKPREIAHSCADEFTDTQEVKRLSYHVLEKISQYV